MFDRVVNVKYNDSKNCFMNVFSKQLKTESYVQVNYGDNKTAYFSVINSSTQFANEHVSISSMYAKALGLEENTLVSVTEIPKLPTVKSMVIVPGDANDYEVLELLAENVQLTLLDQIRVVNIGQKFVIWVANNISVTVSAERVEPKSPGVIDFLTEVVIKPKSDVLEYGDHTSLLYNQKLRTLISRSEMKINKKLLHYHDVNFNLICRLVPISAEQKCKYSDNFTVFISKKLLPGSWIKKDSPLLCSMKLLTPNSNEKVIYVSVLISEETLGVSTHFLADIFASETVFKSLGEHNFTEFCRVVLQPVNDIPRVEKIYVCTKKNYLLNVERKFREFLVKNGDVKVLNRDVVIDIGDNVKCNLKFSPVQAKFCVADEKFVRNCKIYASDEGILTSEVVQNVEDPAELLESISNYQEIVDKVVSTYINENNVWENVLITGKIGSGKSTLLKMLSKRFRSCPNFIFTKVIKGRAIKGKTVDSLLRIFSNIFSELVLYQPSMLLVDDLHSFCENVKGDDMAPNAVYSNRVSEMLHSFLSTFSRYNKIGICATAESTLRLNKNVYSSRGSHFFKNIQSINELTKADRVEILKYFFRNYRVDVDFGDVSIKMEGFVVNDVVDFCRKTVFEAYKDGLDLPSVVLKQEHVERALKSTCVLSLQNVPLQSGGSKDFDDIGGLQDIKNILTENLMWPAQYPGVFVKAPLRLQSGLLLYGPPGTGKTLLAAAAARHCRLRLISVKGPELLSKYIGASEQAVRDVFQKAQSAQPCILFFDEFDSLAPRRGHDNTGVTDRVVNQLLTQLDGVETLSGVYVLAATSRPDLLDPALLRPGRLDRQILCSLPSKEDRLDILRVLSKNLDLTLDVNLEEIAEITESYSGADLQSILYTAQLSTIDHLLDESKQMAVVQKTQITQEHLMMAVNNTKPSLSAQERLKYDKIYKIFEGGSVVEDFKAGSKATLA